jgi:2-keto-4-pentenoate hydratase/2-oxohepta-3-ene-1,7-dioic acid hydratase in catechol pathway
VPAVSAERVEASLCASRIRDMIFPIARLIAYISTFSPLAPGDVIVTGTPGGVGAKRTPPIWMKAGDQVEVEIGVIGTLLNIVRDGS